MPLPKNPYIIKVRSIIPITPNNVFIGAKRKTFNTAMYLPVKPFSLLKSPLSDALIASRASSVSVPFLPSHAPSAGITISAITNEADRVIMIVIGINFIKSPVVSGQKSKGKNTASVVAVDAMIGQAILLDASLNALNLSTPSAIRLSAYSTTTMAPSTNIPTLKISANKTTMFKV